MTVVNLHQRTRLPATTRLSPNREPRRHNAPADMLILHYTAMAGGAEAVDWLCLPASKVSCHYLVDDDGSIVQMVDEADRAWHAGVAHWAGENDINSRSIGIEIQNGAEAAGWPDYPDRQMRTVIALCRDIIDRHRIAAERVLAHSDVAPARKIDPGERFDWERLARNGVGLWLPPAPVEGDRGLAVGDGGDDVLSFQSDLQRFGYGIAPSGVFDPETEIVTKAFQRHWRPRKVDGRADASTRLSLSRLLSRVLVTT